ncbi:hypothetical protein IBTHAUMO2_740002 [Nitrosopumilaceae archaeon]|nr:hypothetical protein IBTHAUMO2_740002 [Nitrosopumilaceae archaeon]
MPTRANISPVALGGSRQVPEIDRYEGSAIMEIRLLRRMGDCGHQGGGGCHTQGVCGAGDRGGSAGSGSCQ